MSWLFKRERRDLSAEESAHYDRIDRDIDKLNDEIAARERRAAALKVQPKAKPHRMMTLLMLKLSKTTRLTDRLRKTLSKNV